ncbi:hypothetical protein LPJ57_009156, partial [Coemansia sp. RSA 486]
GQQLPRSFRFMRQAEDTRLLLLSDAEPCPTCRQRLADLCACPAPSCHHLLVERRTAQQLAAAQALTPVPELLPATAAATANDAETAAGDTSAPLLALPAPSLLVPAAAPTPAPRVPPTAFTAGPDCNTLASPPAPVAQAPSDHPRAMTSPTAVPAFASTPSVGTAPTDCPMSDDEIAVPSFDASDVSDASTDGETQTSPVRASRPLRTRHTSKDPASTAPSPASDSRQFAKVAKPLKTKKAGKAELSRAISKSGTQFPTPSLVPASARAGPPCPANLATAEAADDENAGAQPSPEAPVIPGATFTSARAIRSARRTHHARTLAATRPRDRASIPSPDRHATIPALNLLCQNMRGIGRGNRAYSHATNSWQQITDGENRYRESAARTEKLSIFTAALRRDNTQSAAHAIDVAFVQELNCTPDPASLFCARLAEYQVLSPKPGSPNEFQKNLVSADNSTARNTAASLYDTGIFVHQCLGEARLEQDASCTRATFVTVPSRGLLLVSVHGPFDRPAGSMTAFHNDIRLTIDRYR